MPRKRSRKKKASAEGGGTSALDLVMASMGIEAKAKPSSAAACAPPPPPAADSVVDADARDGWRGEYEPDHMGLTMHQPWASLLVHGIKRIEGRSWRTRYRGKLWIHAAAKEPEADTIRACEEQYRTLYLMDGVAPEDIAFPKVYPTSCLLGYVQLVGCVSQAALQRLEPLSDSLRTESESEQCWLCESPQRLIMPFPMGGQHKLWKLDRRTVMNAEQGLKAVAAPVPTSFPPSSALAEGDDIDDDGTVSGAIHT